MMKLVSAEYDGTDQVMEPAVSVGLLLINAFG